MTTNELLKSFRKVRDEYGATDIGYDNRNQLQDWRKQLVSIHAALSDRTSTYSANKILQERRKDTVRAEEYIRLSAEAKSKAGGAKSATAIKEEIGATEAYKQWSKDFADAYGKWQQFTDFQESVKLMIDSIASHMRNIQVTDYLDPK